MSLVTRRIMASRLRMVRSPFQNVSLSGWGRGHDSRNDSTLAIFTSALQPGVPASNSWRMIVFFSGSSADWYFSMRARTALGVSG